MRLRRVLALVSLAALGLTSAGAEAQRSVDVGRFRPALDRDGFLGIQGTAMPGSLAWNAGMWLSYQKQPLRVSVADREVDVIRHRFVGDLQAQMGFGRRFALAIDMPLVLHQTADPAPLRDDRGPLAAQALGDLRVVGRARLYGRDPSPSGRSEGLGVALLGGLTLPTGDEDTFASEGTPTTDLHLLADFNIFGLGAGIMIGWRHRFEDRAIGASLFRDLLLFGLALRFPVPWVEGLGVILETRGSLDARDPLGGGPASGVDGDLGFTYRVGDLNLVALVGTAFKSGVGTPAVHAALGLHWAPRALDTDGDGIPDHLDQCPHLPEDLDGFEDDDGCLDLDNDGDGIPDADDRCPNLAPAEGQDEDEDGCP
ncbi:MAG: hypothetical protein KF901_02220 [Myxococcales bacterium]|nr:hypothetical protein [Myxococcales bacterium]